jgi:hypothetical protein
VISGHIVVAKGVGQLGGQEAHVLDTAGDATGIEKEVERADDESLDHIGVIEGMGKLVGKE